MEAHATVANQSQPRERPEKSEYFGADLRNVGESVIRELISTADLTIFPPAEDP